MGEVSPARGTRPRNRRALLLAAAAELFAEHGYDQVGVGDVAAAVGIGPSALYRHFSGKQELLHQVIVGGIAPIRDLVADLDLREPEPALRRMARAALDGRHLPVLWQRESRHLAGPARADALSDLRGVYQILSERVHDARPDLEPAAAGALAGAMASVLGSPSYHHVELARPAFDDLLAELAQEVLETPLHLDFPPAVPPPPPGPLRFASRREALLAEAIRMFAAHGYAAVGNEDIAAAVGVAGPTIYNHFGSKVEMLNASVRRGTETLLNGLSVVYRVATDAEDALRRLIRSYLDFTSANSDLMSLLISESGHLPGADRRRARDAQRVFVDEWVHVLREVHPDLGRAVSRIRVHAVLMIVNDAARSARLQRSPGTRGAIEAVGSRLLRLPAVPRQPGDSG